MLTKDQQKVLKFIKNRLPAIDGTFTPATDKIIAELYALKYIHAYHADYGIFHEITEEGTKALEEIN